jgi:hypothetical protein
VSAATAVVPNSYLGSKGVELMSMDNKPVIKKLTPEEKDEIFNKAMEALERDDIEECDRYCKLLPADPVMLNILKRSSGIEAVIDSGINLIEAVEKYGEDWLRS